MPTSNLWNRLEIRFPTEFNVHYDKPLQYFNGARGGNAPFPPMDFMTEEVPHHQRWRDESYHQVREAKRGLVSRKIRQTTGVAHWHQAIEGGCSCEGGNANMMSPSTIEGANVLAGRARPMLGGTMRTQAGSQYVKKKLAERIQSLDKLDAAASGADYWTETPSRTSQLSEDDAIVEMLGENLDILSDAVATANWTSDSVTASKKYLVGLQKAGWKIPQNLITPQIRETQDMIIEINKAGQLRDEQSVFNLDPVAKSNLRSIYVNLERAYNLLVQLSTASDLAPAERKMFLSATTASRRKALRRVNKETLPENDLSIIGNYSNKEIRPGIDYNPAIRLPDWYTQPGSRKAMNPRGYNRRVLRRSANSSNDTAYESIYSPEGSL